MMKSEINNIFTYHPPKDDQTSRYEKIRSTAKDMSILIELLCPDSREKDFAIMKIEESVFWANAAIARHE